MPLGQNKTTDKKKAFDKPSTGLTIKALIAEDEPILRSLMEMIFQHRRQQAVVVSNGKAALEAWKTEEFDIILMDVQMPGMDGLETTKKLRSLETSRKSGRTPIIAITAHALKEDMERCKAAGMDDFIAKPIDIEALFIMMAKHLKSQ